MPALRSQKKFKQEPRESPIAGPSDQDRYICTVVSDDPDFPIHHEPLRKKPVKRRPGKAIKQETPPPEPTKDEAGTTATTPTPTPPPSAPATVSEKTYQMALDEQKKTMQVYERKLGVLWGAYYQSAKDQDAVPTSDMDEWFEGMGFGSK